MRASSGVVPRINWRQASVNTLNFDITIHAPRHQVWQALIGPDTYPVWTAPFAEGSTFAGSWDEGASIRFLGPSGDGMLAVIAEHRPAEVISMCHVGMIDQGVEDTTSEKVRAWTPAYENYRFTDVPGGCRVDVSLDTVADYEQYMRDTFPKALAELKRVCERPAAGA